VLEYSQTGRIRKQVRRTRKGRKWNVIYGDLQRGDQFIPRELKFDIIWCTSVFEHLPYPHVAMKQLARIAKPEAFISWSVPFFARYHPDPLDFFRFTHDALHLLANDAGLHVNSTFGFGDRMVTTASLQKPLHAPAGVDYESPEWLYSANLELHSRSPPPPPTSWLSKLLGS